MALPFSGHLVGAVSMVAGSLGVVTLVGFMNQSGDLSRERAEERVTSFVVEEKPPEPDKPRERKQRVKRSRPKSGQQPAAPRVGNALSDVPLGLPLLEPSDVGTVDDSVLGETRDVVMTADTVDVAPRALERPSPDIPVRIRKQGLSGRVVLNLLIGRDGRVQQTKTLESLPAGVFDEVAVEAVKRWRFSPALYRGEPVPVWGRQTLDFGAGG